MVILSAAGLIVGPALGVSFWWIIAFFIIGMMLMVLADVGKNASRLGPLDILGLFGLYTILSFWDVLILAILLPAIFIDMLLGAFMAGITLLAAAGLIIYFIEHILHHDIEGVSAMDTPQQAGIVLIVLVASFLIAQWRIKKDDEGDGVGDRVNRYTEKVRHQLLAVARTIEEGD